MYCRNSFILVLDKLFDDNSRADNPLAVVEQVFLVYWCVEDTATDFVGYTCKVSEVAAPIVATPKNQVL